MSRNIWVIGNVSTDEDRKNNNNIIAMAQRLGEDVSITAMVFNKGAALISEDLQGADELIWIKQEGSAKYEAEICFDIIKDKKPWAIFVPYTTHYSQLGAILAVKLKAGLAADCTKIFMTESGLIMHRPAFGGGVEADIRSINSEVHMASIHTISERLVCNKRDTKIVNVRWSNYIKDQLTVLNTIQKEKAIKLSDFKVIVSGGAGVGSSDGFNLLARLAEKFSGQLAGSRGAVDAGFISWERQIGQTGTVIRPDIYLNFGISGAVQHMAGIRNAKTIISVNSDPKAPIFSFSDIAIVSDWKIVAEMLLNLN